MKFGSLLLVAFALNIGCATMRSDGVPEPLSYQCNDVVLVGRLINQQAGETELIEGDLLGHGWFTASVRVERQIRGEPVRSLISVRYFAHTYFREDRDFMFVLSEEDHNSYLIRRARLMLGRPRLADACT